MDTTKHIVQKTSSKRNILITDIVVFIYLLYKFFLELYISDVHVKKF